jgi:outer membrane protein assembly factor BamB
MGEPIVTHASIRLFFVLLLSAPLAAAGPADTADWGTFRGPNRDGLSPDTGLLKDWPGGGPPLSWKTKGLGLGASSVVVTGDKVITMGDFDNACHLIAMSVSDGKRIWATEMGPTLVDAKWLHGPRAVPSTDGSIVIATNPNGDVLCADVATGKEKWRKHLKKDFGGEVRAWHYSDSPLFDGDNVVFIPGGSRGTVLALKKATGDFVWQSAELKDKAEYTSLCPAEIGGKRQYILLTQETLAGISAADGKVLWQTPRKGATAVIPTPIYKDGLVFVTSGYGVGCNAFKITEAGGKFSIEEAYSGKQMKNHHGGVILVGDYLYGLDDPGTLKCLEFKTGKVVWENRSVGKGSIAYADGHFVVRSEKKKGSEIALVEASSGGYKEHGRFEQPDQSGYSAWPHPVIIGGKLYLRDHDVLLCYDVKAK